MKKFLLLLLLSTISLTAFSQIKQDKRIEIELDDGYSREIIHEFGEKGFIMSSVSDDKKNGEKEWNYKLYNTDLELSKQQSIKLPSKFYLDESLSDEYRNYTLFKDKKGNFSIVTVGAEDCQTHQVSGKLPKKCRISEMAILGDYAYFNGKIKKFPYLFSINWKTGKQKPLALSIDGIHPKDLYLEEFQLLEKTNEIMLYVGAKTDRPEDEVYIIKLDDQGNKKDVFHLTKKIKENIVYASAQNIEDDKYIFTGTYSTKNRHLSEGIYFCETNGDKINYINFHKFTDLNNFLSYLPKRRQEKIEKKKKKKEAKGKDFKLNYRIASHEIIVRKDGYILLGEAYYPTYRTESYQTTTTTNGVTRTTTQTRRVFDGYQYTHAFVAKFGFNGELEWDQTFEMWPSYKPYRVKRFISIAEQNNNNVKMVFVSRSRIISQIVDNEGEISKEVETEPIETTYSGDKTKFTYSNINYWYKNTFIAYGAQKIKNKEDKSVKRKRKVYFVSKIIFE